MLFTAFELYSPSHLFRNPDQDHTRLNRTLNVYLRRRFGYFGVTGDSGQTNLSSRIYLFSPKQTQNDGPLSDMLKKADHLRKFSAR